MVLTEAGLPAAGKDATHMDGGAPPIAKLRQKGQVRLYYAGKMIFAVCG